MAKSKLASLESRGKPAIIVGGTTEAKQSGIFLSKKLTTDGRLASIAAMVQLQQLALLVSDKRGTNPDRPRNLAKSVTVE